MAYIDKINKNSTDYDLQDSKAARSVDGTTASHVELTNQIYTESTQATTASFAYRTTAGDVSIETGDATIQYIDGNTVQTGHTDEVKNVTTDFASSGASVSVDWATYDSRVNSLIPGYASGVATFTYDENESDVWGFVVVDDSAQSQASGRVNNSGLQSQWGITKSGVFTTGDTFTVDYTELVIGSLTTATPTSFVSTGFNQYDATAGYAHVVGNNQYRIDGTYTSLGFTTTVGGATTPVTVTNNRFTPTEDGYIYVTGGSGNILIALVWSGTMDSEPYSAYSTTTVTIPTVDASNNALPTASYGMPSVHGVADRLSFADKTYVQRIGHYSYSVANLETVQAMGVDYWYDNSDIFYVLATPVTYTLADSVSGAYTANDYGTEEITGTSVPMNVNIVYGNSLVDKLRNMLPIQSIGTGLTLTGAELSASGGGGSMTELTSADYNWPSTGTKNAIAAWLLPDGIYQTKGLKTYWNTSANETGQRVFVKGSASNGTAIIMRISAATTSGNVTIYYTNVPDGTDSMTVPQASSYDIFADPEAQYKVKIGGGASTAGTQAVAIGRNASASGIGAVALGKGTKAQANGAVAIGQDSTASTKGEVNIGTSTVSYGYNNSNYRLLTGLYSPQGAHDAANKEYVDPTTDSSAPTTATVGRLGQIFIDTTNADAYMCVAVDSVTPSYTWKKISI